MSDDGANDLQPRKRSQPNDPIEDSSVKRRRTSTEGGSDGMVKVERLSASHSNDLLDASVDQDADCDKLTKLLNACRKERDIVASNIRSQV